MSHSYGCGTNYINERKVNSAARALIQLLGNTCVQGPACSVHVLLELKPPNMSHAHI